LNISDRTSNADGKAWTNTLFETVCQSFVKMNCLDGERGNLGRGFGMCCGEEFKGEKGVQ
jgi:hypothetical protein